MRRLYLVRHVDVEPAAGIAPHEWRPTAAGLAAARRLGTAPVWRGVALVASSPEPKAVATAEPIAAAAGRALCIDADLREVSRTPAPLIDARAHRERVGRYLAGEAVAGWEPAEDARLRFERAVDRLAAESRGDLTVVSHGTVVALYLGLAPDEWAAIPLPAVAVADLDTRTLLEPFRDLDALRAGSRG